MITKITKEQEVLIPQYIQKWVDLASTPIDRSKLKDIFLKIYGREKIIIIGDAGRGKSTLASKLSEKLNIPCYSTDDYFYEVKFTKPRDRQEALSQISNIYKQD